MPAWCAGDEVYGRSTEPHLHWTWWRRRHQARARWLHHRTDSADKPPHNHADKDGCH